MLPPKLAPTPTTVDITLDVDGRAARPSTPANRLVLTARIAEIGALRFTPVGLPAIDLRLEHESQSEEAGQPRQVKLALKAVAFGAGAERIARLTLGSAWRWKGFLAVHGKSKYPVFHIQEFQEFQQD